MRYLPAPYCANSHQSCKLSAKQYCLTVSLPNVFFSPKDCRISDLFTQQKMLQLSYRIFYCSKKQYDLLSNLLSAIAENYIYIQYILYILVQIYIYLVLGSGFVSIQIVHKQSKLSKEKAAIHSSILKIFFIFCFPVSSKIIQIITK